MLKYKIHRDMDTILFYLWSWDWFHGNIKIKYNTNEKCLFTSGQWWCLSLSPPAAPPVPLPPWKQMKSHLTRIFHISPIPLTWILYTVHLLHGFWSLMIKSTKWIYCFGSVLANMKLKKMKNNIFGMGESVLLKPDLCNETKCKDWNFKRNPSMKIKGHER